MSRWYKRAFFNSGRADNAGQVISSLDELERPARTIFLNEIREGDKGYNELKLVREALGDTHKIYFANTKEPIAVPKSQVLRVKRTRIYKGFPGLKRQSPPRMIEEIIYDGGNEPDNVSIGGHFYAGAKNGDRKPWVKKFLTFWYNRMRRKMKRIVRKHHKAGRHVEYFMDTNWRGFPPLHPNEIRLFEDWPDVGAVIPAPGYRVAALNHSSRPGDIEKTHSVHFTNHRFEKIKSR